MFSKEQGDIPYKSVRPHSWRTSTSVWQVLPNYWRGSIWTKPVDQIRFHQSAQQVNRKCCSPLHLHIHHIPPPVEDHSCTPIFKKGDKNNAANYRPISLKSIYCKVCEHIIAKSHLEVNDFLTDSQAWLGGKELLWNTTSGTSWWVTAGSGKEEAVCLPWPPIEDTVYCTYHRTQIRAHRWRTENFRHGLES